MTTPNTETQKLKDEIATLKAEVKELRSKGESLCHQNGKLLVEAHDLKAERDRLREALEEIATGRWNIFAAEGIARAALRGPPLGTVLARERRRSDD